MLESIFSNGTSTTSTLQLSSFLICIVFALAYGLILALVYSYRARHTTNFVVTLAVIPAIVCVIIAVINGNVGAGVAVAGAFSLVRFRSVAGSARDIGFIFLAMCVGLVCGMGYVAYAGLVTIVIGGAFLVLQLSGFGVLSAGRDRTLKITVPEDLDYTTLFDSILNKYTTYAELVSVKTTNMGSLYRLSYNVGLKDLNQQKALIDEIRCRNGNLEVALTHQEMITDEL